MAYVCVLERNDCKGTLTHVTQNKIQLVWIFPRRFRPAVPLPTIHCESETFEHTLMLPEDSPKSLGDYSGK